MTYRGKVKNGVVVLDEPSAIPDGTAVSVRPLRTAGRRPRARRRIPSLYDQLKPVIGIAKGLPTDLARNHNHYLHGWPKE